MAAKQEVKVYEYFKMSDFHFTGVFCTYIDAMWKQNTIPESIFTRLVDLYAVAAIVGLRIQNRCPADTSSEQKRTVQLAQITNNYHTLMPIMRLVLLLDESRGFSMEQRIDSAFRTPETQEDYEKNMELFNSYARGGIEYLYQELVMHEPEDEEDHENKKISNMIALLKNPLNADDVLP